MVARDPDTERGGEIGERRSFAVGELLAGSREGRLKPALVPEPGAAAVLRDLLVMKDLDTWRVSQIGSAIGYCASRRSAFR